MPREGREVFDKTMYSLKQQMEHVEIMYIVFLMKKVDIYICMEVVQLIHIKLKI